MVEELRRLAASATNEREVRDVTSRIAQLNRLYRVQNGIGLPGGPVEQALALDDGYVNRPHISYLSQRIQAAVHDVERGQSRRLAVSMPPREGKSTLLSYYSPLWLLRRHPEWKIITASYDASLVTGWARDIRTMIEDKPDLGIALKPDAGAGSNWRTVEGGGMFATSTKGVMTGRGARVLIIDDPVKDFVEAHSLLAREALWKWWLSVAQTRLEPPSLVIVVMTRWHEDDFVGRVFNSDHEGDPRDWEKVSLPAIAEGDNDVLGRQEGEPLLSPLVSETNEQAVERWEENKRSVGTYTFSAMYQQRPAPAKGAIFDAGWWKFWTVDESRVSDDGRVILLDPDNLTSGSWLDSWDCAFKKTTDSDWVVGQRWVRQLANRFLVAQIRDRMSFTDTIKRMKEWALTDDPRLSPSGHLVHSRLIEDAANGPAIIDTLKDQISGLKPITPQGSKEARARAITPEVESGNVYLPHPGDPGNEWVNDLLSELRNFPHDVADDQVDALTQALSGLRTPGKGQVTVPGAVQTARQRWQVPRNVTGAARTDMSRRRPGA